MPHRFSKNESSRKRGLRGKKAPRFQGLAGGLVTVGSEAGWLQGRSHHSQKSGPQREGEASGEAED